MGTKLYVFQVFVVVENIQDICSLQTNEKATVGHSEVSQLGVSSGLTGQDQSVTAKLVHATA